MTIITMLSLLSYIWNHSRRHEIVLNYLQELKHPAENSRYGLCNSLQIPEDSVIVTLTKPTNKQQEWRQCWILKLVRSITPIQAELALCMKENLIAWTHSVRIRQLQPCFRKLFRIGTQDSTWTDGTGTPKKPIMYSLTIEMIKKTFKGQITFLDFYGRVFTCVSWFFRDYSEIVSVK
uniref:Uncharacterized protein n=1 Tax=Rhizophagus irregularis (strain DAOM 181602 / DAOM 197198 / MUCL 43194) TaxID=747089 RepID=U9UZJ3_RHIID